MNRAAFERLIWLELNAAEDEAGHVDKEAVAKALTRALGNFGVLPKFDEPSPPPPKLSELIQIKTPDSTGKCPGCGQLVSGAHFCPGPNGGHHQGIS